MDKFFKAIGRFFKAIWDWIKTTAWVQPLLIVVIVFAIIFSFSSTSPLMKWIKGLANSDTTGEFYEEHSTVFSDLYSDIFVSGKSGYEYNCEDGKRPDNNRGGAGKYLSNSGKYKYDGYSYVVFVNNTSMETTFKTFYTNTLTKEEQKHFYVVDFKNEDNINTYYNVTTKEWENNNGATYYYYLFNHLFDFYISEAYEEYSDAFKAVYGYDVNTRVWEPQAGFDVTTAVNNLTFPIICKYKGSELIDFRFCDNISSDYDVNDTSNVLSHFHAFAK